MSKIPNPCVAQKMLVTAAQMPLIWSQDKYIVAFDEWFGRLRVLVEDGISLADLQRMVLVKVSQYNAEMGMALLIVSNNLLVFDGSYELMGPIDKTLILMSLDNLFSEVHKLNLIGTMERGVI